MSRQLFFESTANFLEWLLAVSICAFIASGFAPLLMGGELSESATLASALVLERAFSAFVFLDNRRSQHRCTREG